MQIPEVIPLMILPNATLFPDALLPLHIFEPRYRRMLSDVLVSHRMFGVALRQSVAGKESPMPIIGVGMVRVCIDAKDDTSNLLLMGMARVECLGAEKYRPYRLERVRVMESSGEDSPEIESLRDRLMDLIEKRLELGTEGLSPGTIPSALFNQKQALSDKGMADTMSEVGADMMKLIDNASGLADYTAATFLRNPFERQIVLSSIDVPTRLNRVAAFLAAEIDSNS